MTQAPALKTQRMQVGGMDCTSCAMKIETSLEKLAGVAEVSVVVSTEQLTVTYDPDRVSEADIQKQVTGLGYTITADKTNSPAKHAVHDHSDHEHISQEEEHDHNHSGGEFSLQWEGVLVGSVITLFILGSIFEGQLHNTPFSIGEYLIFIPAYLLSGWTVLTTAGRNILRGQVFDENFLMTIATLGAIAIHKLPEAVGVMLFFKIGELFQEYSVGRSRRSIKALLEIRPDYANLKIGNEIQPVDPNTVQVGDLIVIKAGEKIPLDGEVIEGSSSVDTSPLTGESVPRSIKVGETILAGTINQTGLLTVRVTKLFQESSINRILELVENASAKKAPTQKFITKFASYYTPIVVISSLLVAFIPPLIIPGASVNEWVYRALVLLVISCPCGLVISIPLGYFGGVGGAAKHGILVKGSAYLDALAQVKTVVFDKTGTLSQGVFNVVEIVPAAGYSPEQLLKIAAHVESQSNHPIAKSILRAYEQPVNSAAITEYAEISGGGITAKIDGQQVLAGNERFLKQSGVEFPTDASSGTVVHLAINHTYAGSIIIADELKPDAAQAITALKSLGVTKTVMLTGDRATVAAQVSQQLGLDSYEAELLPEGKVKAIEALLSKQGKVAFVGDGINDAPVLARADVGIAMGGMGSDAAIETADVVLMTDAPTKIVEAIQIARRTHSIVWQNIILAITIKVLFIGLGLMGLASMWEAVFADVGVALLAILNATRVMK
jgi:Zn2+/Cd2+-exporting ATPase